MTGCRAAGAVAAVLVGSVAAAAAASKCWAPPGCLEAAALGPDAAGELALLQRAARPGPGPSVPSRSHGSRRAEASAAAPEALRLDPVSGQLLDGLGRARIFHGVNVVFKKWPWLPQVDSFDPKDSLTNEDMDLLQEWGFNVVRLGVMWPGVEPAAGEISEYYLKEVASVSDRLAARGVYTLVDLHQDLLSRRFCGEGVPEFYVDALLADPGSRLSQAVPFPGSARLGAALPAALGLELNGSGFVLNSSGFPPVSECYRATFLSYYMSDRVAILFDELLERGTQLNRGAMRYWRSVAAEFAGRPHVLGYELLNEPIRFGATDEVEKAYQALARFYTDAMDHIRAAGAEQPIFYEVPFNHVLGDTDAWQNWTGADFAYHAYCAPGDDGSNALVDLLCSTTQNIMRRTVRKERGSMPGRHGFITEFGAVGASRVELEHVGAWLDMADDFLQSWAYWQLKEYADFTTQNAEDPLYGSDGMPNVQKLRTLTRTYAQAIAGTPVSMHFDRTDGRFALLFKAPGSQVLQAAATEVYLNERLHYPYGYAVSVTPEHCLVHRRTKNRLYAYLSDEAKRGSGCEQIELVIQALSHT